jgi:hypothetical protein
MLKNKTFKNNFNSLMVDGQVQSIMEKRFYLIPTSSSLTNYKTIQQFFNLILLKEKT